MQDKQKLENQIKEAQNAYYNGCEIISDDEYDALVYELQKLDPVNKLLSKVGAEISSKEWKKEKHLVELGSLNKINFPDEMDKWIAEHLDKREVLVVEKLDGLSVGLQFEDGKLTKSLLRGNGLEGENILNNVLKMNGVVDTLTYKFSGTIRGEIILTKSNHQKYFKNYSNPRNASSGLCRASDGQGCKYLTIMAYDAIGEDFTNEKDKFVFLKENGFIIPNYKICKTSLEVTDMWQTYQDKIRASLDYEIDGLVAVCDDVEFQQSLGSTSMRPKGKLAFKFANQFAKTTVKDITWATGSSGRITPICWFEKVTLLGSDIEKASLYNVAYVNKLGIDIAAEVLVCKANEIIPRIEKVVKSTGTIAQIPTHCPACNEKIASVGEYLQCTNFDCPAVASGRIKNWVAELNILELGESLIDKLVESGLVNDVSDLYILSIDELASLDRMGIKSATNVYNSIWKNNPIGLDLLIGGLSIPMIGSSSIRLLMEAGYDTLDKIQNITIEQIENVNGMGTVKAQSLYNGLWLYQEVIDNLMENGLKVKEKIEGKLAGCKIAITGSTENKRAVLEKFIMDNAGENKSSVGRTCTHLVIADIESTSSKAQTARKLGIKLISEKNLLSMNM